MVTSRRTFLTSAAAAAGAAAAPQALAAREHPASDDHDHQTPPSDLALRAKALESLLVEKGLVDPAAVDALVDLHEHKMGPRNGARVVARAWVDPAYKQRLLSDATAGRDRLAAGVATRLGSESRVAPAASAAVPLHCGPSVVQIAQSQLEAH